jgi:vacuolar-type H+-ATPase subunit F/Vma7
MGQVVVLGEPARVMGYALAGALAIEAEGEEVARAWASLPPDASLVVLTPAAAQALGQAVLAKRRHILIVTMPA